MWQILWNWFSTHEWLAIWLEGIALVLIFVWDRIDAKGEHDERMAQIAIAKEQAEAARLAAQSVMNSERAWVTADLAWRLSEGRIMTSTSTTPSGRSISTGAAFKLKLRNDGRTPAWIENVAAGMEILGNRKQLELPITDYIEPLGAGAERIVHLTLSCDGELKTENETLMVHITVSYRDIFEAHSMPLEFSVNPRNQGIRRFEKTNVNFVT